MASFFVHMKGEFTIIRSDVIPRVPAVRLPYEMHCEPPCRLPCVLLNEYCQSEKRPKPFYRPAGNASLICSEVYFSNAIAYDDTI